MDVRLARILVTGGGRGIGKHLATELSKIASHVFVLDSSQDLLNKMAEFANISTHCCDITDPVQVHATIQSIILEGKQVDVCINNAGIIHSEPLINLLSREDKKHNFDNWRRVIDVNLNGLFYVSAHVAEMMVVNKTKGVIINISSISAQGNIGQSAYAASKAAVEALTKTWCKELGMFKIRVACIAPGFFDTPSTKESLTENTLMKWQKNIPLGRLGQLEELLNATKFIIENDYFNGRILALDGGLVV